MSREDHARVLGFLLAMARSMLGCEMHEVWSMEMDGHIVQTKWALLPVDRRRTIMN